MKCGHTANAKDENGNSVCAICIGINEGATQIANESPNLENRNAECCYCNKIKKSSFDLPFFEYKPNEKYDKFYCGCWGWD